MQKSALRLPLVRPDNRYYIVWSTLVRRGGVEPEPAHGMLQIRREGLCFSARGCALAPAYRRTALPSKQVLCLDLTYSAFVVPIRWVGGLGD